MPRHSIAQMNPASAAYCDSRPKLTMNRNNEANTYISESDLMPPMRSAIAPPSGRNIEPANTQAAVKKPAVTADNPYCVLK